MELQTAIKPQSGRKYRPGFGRRRQVNRDKAIRYGIVVQPRFPRALHQEIKKAASQDGVAISRWILERCNEAIEARQKKSAA
jgi:hypothetical protein